MEPLSLAVVAGPHAGAVTSLAGGPVTVGRSPHCGLALPDADTSRRHAVVQAGVGCAWVHDLGSTNGTTVDGAPVGVVPVPLAIGSQLRVGESLLTADTPARSGDDPVALLRGPAPPLVRLGVLPGGVAVRHDLLTASLALAGPYATGTAWWVVAQAVAALPWSRVRVAVASVRAAYRWQWTARLPGAQRIVEGPASVADAVAGLRATCPTSGRPGRTLFVADLRGHAEPVPGLADLARYGPADGVSVLVLGSPGDDVLAHCGARAVPVGDTGTRLSLDGGPEFVLDAVGERWAGRLAIALTRATVAA